MAKFESLLNQVHNCKLCEASLIDGVRPVLQINPKAKILIAGQAPGRKVHESGIPFNDASGKRLRQWMGLTQEQFYDDSLVAILPMSFCFPGSSKQGDLPPRLECAPAWREQLIAHLKHVEISLVLGKYAQQYHLDNIAENLTKTVENWQAYWPTQLPLPHPSPRNNRWFNNNPWFEQKVIPKLQQRIEKILSNSE